MKLVEPVPDRSGLPRDPVAFFRKEAVHDRPRCVRPPLTPLALDADHARKNGGAAPVALAHLAIIEHLTEEAPAMLALDDLGCVGHRHRRYHRPPSGCPRVRSSLATSPRTCEALTDALPVVVGRISTPRASAPR